MLNSTRFLAGALAIGAVAGVLSPGVAHAAPTTIVYMSVVTTGTGQTVGPTIGPTTTPFSGTMVTTLPRFNPLLGTLIQADFEFAANANSSWTAVPGPTGNVSLTMSGAADVDGVAMGTIPLSLAGPITNPNPTVTSDTGFANLTETSGAHFNTLTGPGVITLSYVYSGTNTVDVSAVGAFDWGGSAHVGYTYIPAEVPEPATATLLVPALATLLRARRRPN